MGFLRFMLQREGQTTTGVIKQSLESLRTPPTKALSKLCGSACVCLCVCEPCMEWVGGGGWGG